MAKIWGSRRAIDRAVETICAMMQQQGALPPEYQRAVKAGIEGAQPGLVSHFYAELTARCPAALGFFVDKPVLKGG